MTLQAQKPINGGRFDFDDGGTYCGGWEDGKAHGNGVCTGPKGQGEYSGSWHYGFEVSGVYTWPSGSTYEGHWQNGKRHGLGVESRGRWVYRGEWTQGFKGRYGVRQCTTSSAKYEGTWANGLQDGYGSETYADGGTYQGQWLRGLRHGYGVRTSAPFGLASHVKTKPAGSSVTLQTHSGIDPASERDKKIDDARGGFVLKAKGDEPPARRRSLGAGNTKRTLFQGLRLRKQRSTGDLERQGVTGSMRSTASTTSWTSTDSAHSAYTSASQVTDSNASFVSQDEQVDSNVTETFMGEWKNDKRCGFGVSERSDGLKYEGEWYNNKKYGYGVTTFKDGTKEEGKYKNNVLITSQKKKHLFIIRSAKFRERIESAMNAANRAAKIALQKADIAISRTATARGKAEQADIAAVHAKEDADIARTCAKQYAPELLQTIAEIRGQTPMRSSHMNIPNISSHLSQPQENVISHVRKQSIYSPESPVVSDFHHEYEQDIPPNNYASRRPSGTVLDYDYGQDQDYHPKLDGPMHYPSSTSMKMIPPSASDRMNRTVPTQQSLASNYLPRPSYTAPRSQVHPQYQSEHPTIVSENLDPNVRAYPNTNYGDVNSYPDAKYNDVRSYSDAKYNNESMSSAYVDPRNSQKYSQKAQRSDPMSSHRNKPVYNIQQAMSDHFDHYQRPPSRSVSRDNSVDRFGHMGRSSRASSRQNLPSAVPQDHTGMNIRGGTPFNRGTTPFNRGKTPLTDRSFDSTTDPWQTDNVPRRQVPLQYTQAGSQDFHSGNGSVINFDSNLGSFMIQSREPSIPPTPTGSGPKRTESLYINPVVRKQIPIKTASSGQPLKRKKSLPDPQALPKATSVMSREEASVLSSARRQEVQRLQVEAERYRANPFLYLFNPDVKDWISRQKFIIFVLFINLSLAFMFIKLLT